MRKAALLVRVSTQDQQHDRQLTELSEYAESMGLKVVETIVETVSGAKRNEERQAILRLIKLAQTGKINKVLVHEVTRLGRNTSQVLATLEELHKHKVSVVVKSYNIETLNPDGSLNSMAQFLFTLLTDIGRMERDTLITRVKSGMAEAKRKGIHVGRPKDSTKGKEAMLKEYKAVVKYIKADYTIRETATLTGVSVSTVQRVKKLL
ncbi:recombinase family protein [Rufibacter immobilis]|uniref:Recombinase family protein n=1 Tax=Rufibacter immobilis TaxID=1348778 RepID=A0A3M9MPB2_9BACT|nr:recombinase family protein [Rufibacter immobilis]RNI27356.1 recombinase family protein [Rufibacter immobilis]